MLLLLFLANPAVATESGVNIVLTSQDPFPVEPGENVEIEVDIQNIGRGEATNFSVTILPPNNFKLLPGEDEVISFNRIGAYSSAKQTYSLHVDESTISGDYNIEFRVSFGGAITQIEEVTITVQGNPRIILEDVTLTPDIIESGGRANLIASVKNVGTGTARHLSLTLNSTDYLIPVLSDSFYYVGDLFPGQSGTANMEISVDDSAEEQTYVMKLTATYNDESNTEITEIFDIGIPVTGKVQLDIIKTEPNYLRSTLEFEIANKGTSEAKSVEAKLYLGNELIDVDYTSQIKPTKKTTFTFPLVEEGNGRLEITYTGPGLERNTIVNDIVFNYSLVNGANGTAAAGTGLLLLIIIIIIVFIFWRKRRKKKKK